MPIKPVDKLELSFHGKLADDHLLDMVQMGTALRGFAKAHARITHFVMFGEILEPRQRPRIDVLAGATKPGSISIDVVITNLQATLPIFGPISVELAINIIPHLWKGIISLLTGKTSAADNAMNDIAELAKQHVEHLREARRIEFVERMKMLEILEQLANNNKPSMKDMVSPVGRSCSHEKVVEGKAELVIDEPTADIIRADEDLMLSDEQTFIVYIDAINLKTGSAKVRNAETSEVWNASITDPALKMPHNPYTVALDMRQPLSVRAKAVMAPDGTIKRLYISNTASKAA